MRNFAFQNLVVPVNTLLEVENDGKVVGFRAVSRDVRDMKTFVEPTYSYPTKFLDA